METIEKEGIYLRGSTSDRFPNSSTEQEVRSMTTAHITKCEKLNVRAKPELNSEVRRIIGPEDEVIIDPNFKDPTFYKVKIGNTIGYAVKIYLSINK